MSGEATAALSSQLATISAIGDLDPVAVDAGRLAGRVDVLLWCQTELQQEIAAVQASDRFADTRALETFLVRVQDSLKAVQDGSGTWAGLVRTAVDAAEAGGTLASALPDTENGG